MNFNCSAVTVDRSIPLGRYSRTRPLKFSLVAQRQRDAAQPLGKGIGDGARVHGIEFDEHDAPAGALYQSADG